MIPTPKRSALISLLVHVMAVVFLVLMSGVVKTPLLPDKTTTVVFPSDLVKYQVTHVATAGGSGGGQRDDLPVKKGDPPKPSTHPYIPPTTKTPDFQPTLIVEQAILADPSDQIPRTMGVIGDPSGIMAAIGGGSGTNGIGGRGKDGVGPGDGVGVGGRGTRGGYPGFRDDTTEPKLVSKVEPIYSDDARKARVQGSVFLRIVVNERGRAESIEVTQPLGLGLDERAIEAVKQWRFLPGMRAGKPVPTTAIVQVTFRLL